MQALRKQSNYQTVELLVFPAPMRTQPPIPEIPPPATWWNRHGNTAQWGALIVSGLAFIGLFINIALTVYFHHEAEQAQTSDEHTNTLIGNQVNPELKGLTTDLGNKIDGVSTKIDLLSDRVSRIEGGLDHRISSLETKAEQQSSLARLMNPNRILAQMREEIELAESSNRTLPASDLSNYRNAVHALPPSTHEYWTTVAAIINYQSKLNQMSGEAPDPEKVARRCPGVPNNTSSGMYYGNIFEGFTYSDCVVDLDSNAFVHDTFRDSVIRYHGGPVSLDGAVFVNCRFVLDLPASLPNTPTPAQTKLLMTLLDSLGQKTITVSTHS